MTDHDPDLELDAIMKGLSREVLIDFCNTEWATTKMDERWFDDHCASPSDLIRLAYLAIRFTFEDLHLMLNYVALTRFLHTSGHLDPYGPKITPPDTVSDRALDASIAVACWAPGDYTAGDYRRQIDPDLLDIMELGTTLWGRLTSNTQDHTNVDTAVASRLAIFHLATSKLGLEPISVDDLLSEFSNKFPDWQHRTADPEGLKLATAARAVYKRKFEQAQATIQDSPSPRSLHSVQSLTTPQLIAFAQAQWAQDEIPAAWFQDHATSIEDFAFIAHLSLDHSFAHTHLRINYVRLARLLTHCPAAAQGLAPSTSTSDTLTDRALDVALANLDIHPSHYLRSVCDSVFEELMLACTAWGRYTNDPAQAADTIEKHINDILKKEAIHLRDRKLSAISPETCLETFEHKLTAWRLHLETGGGKQALFKRCAEKVVAKMNTLKRTGDHNPQHANNKRQKTSEAEIAPAAHEERDTASAPPPKAPAKKPTVRKTPAKAKPKATPPKATKLPAKPPTKTPPKVPQKGRRMTKPEFAGWNVEEESSTDDDKALSISSDSSSEDSDSDLNSTPDMIRSKIMLQAAYDHKKLSVFPIHEDVDYKAVCFADCKCEGPIRGQLLYLDRILAATKHNWVFAGSLIRVIENMARLTSTNSKTALPTCAAHTAAILAILRVPSAEETRRRQRERKTDKKSNLANHTTGLSQELVETICRLTMVMGPGIPIAPFMANREAQKKGWLGGLDSELHSQHLTTPHFTDTHLQGREWNDNGALVLTDITKHLQRLPKMDGIFAHDEAMIKHHASLGQPAFRLNWATFTPVARALQTYPITYVKLATMRDDKVTAFQSVPIAPILFDGRARDFIEQDLEAVAATNVGAEVMDTYYVCEEMGPNCRAAISTLDLSTCYEIVGHITDNAIGNSAAAQPLDISWNQGGAGERILRTVDNAAQEYDPLSTASRASPPAFVQHTIPKFSALTVKAVNVIRLRANQGHEESLRANPILIYRSRLSPLFCNTLLDQLPVLGSGENASYDENHYHCALTNGWAHRNSKLENEKRWPATALTRVSHPIVDFLTGAIGADNIDFLQAFAQTTDGTTRRDWDVDIATQLSRNQTFHALHEINHYNGRSYWANHLASLNTGDTGPFLRFNELSSDFDIEATRLLRENPATFGLLISREKLGVLDPTLVSFESATDKWELERGVVMSKLPILITWLCKQYEARKRRQEEKTAVPAPEKRYGVRKKIGGTRTLTYASRR